jgi:ABC-2 type transport system ATP-binding protein
MNEFAISTDGLVKRFKTRKGWITAVDHLTLRVRPGETYGLIGPDGAGKSTTIRVVLGLLTRTQEKARSSGWIPCTTHIRSVSGSATLPSSSSCRLI